jgi:hypothetical protein
MEGARLMASTRVERVSPAKKERPSLAESLAVAQPPRTISAAAVTPSRWPADRTVSLVVFPDPSPATCRGPFWLVSGSTVHYDVVTIAGDS